jgi:hypothetical protein
MEAVGLLCLGHEPGSGSELGDACAPGHRRRDLAHSRSFSMPVRDSDLRDGVLRRTYWLCPRSPAGALKLGYFTERGQTVSLDL